MIKKYQILVNERKFIVISNKLANNVKACNELLRQGSS